MKHNPGGLINFYSNTAANHSTIRQVVRLKEEIDPFILQKAVEKIRDRYPFFYITAIKKPGEVFHEIVANEKPVVITEGRIPPVLGTEESNGHYLSLNYENNTLYVDIIHAFCDGASLFEYIKTLLYYYLQEKYQTELPDAEIQTLENLPGPEELEDPLLSAIPEHVFLPPVVKRPKRFNLLDSPWVSDAQETVYVLKVNEQQFVDFMRRVDSSPASLSATLIARAISDLHPDLDTTIRIGMVTNLKKALGRPQAHHYNLLSAALDYPPEMKTWPLEKLGTATRGMLVLQSDPDYLLSRLDDEKKVIEKIYAQPSLELARKESFQHLRNNPAVGLSANVSYLGKTKFGALEEYLEEVYPIVPASKLMIELEVLNGYFYITFLQHFSGDHFVKAFLSLLHENGVEAELIRKEEMEYAKLYIPE